LKVKTIFAPFALCASLGLVVALGAADPPARAETPKNAQTEKYVERAAGHLIVPVRGLASTDLSDTWGAARSNGRHHEGIDIMAPQGAPVLAAADGRIVRFWNSELGGISLYQADESGDVVYYYAHLSSYAEHLKQGDRVRQGDVIAYVGETGNATTPHLHFEIHRTSDAHRWWSGRAINPYPYLRGGQAPV
jgi:murein DD-endopeptidase MepM/ murein hydrolase activator NlpD